MYNDFSEIDDLYQQVILDHGRKPRNFHEIDSADGSAEGYNPLCGDRVTVFVKLDGDTVVDVAFTGSGCAICTASASMMTQVLKGKTAEELNEMFGLFHNMLTDEKDVGPDDQLGKLAVFAGVKKYPIRIKCATLPWHTLKAALEHDTEAVTTE